MFRLVAQQAARRSGASVQRFSTAAAAPSVKDLLIDLTFVDPSGARRKAKGMIGT